MTRNLTLMAILSIFLISLSAFAQRTTTIHERVQQTYVNTNGVNLAYWLRIHPADVYDTDVRSLYIRGTSFLTNQGNMEIFVNGRLFSRLAFGRIPTEVPVNFLNGTRLHQITIRVNGEVYVDSVTAVIIERRFVPVPPPIPPRYPAPIPPRPAPIPPRPTPPRHEPAPRPAPPRHEPAPRPAPPRHEPAPRPAPPRHEPAPRPTPPRQGPAPRPGQPRPGTPGPRR